MLYVLGLVKSLKKRKICLSFCFCLIDLIFKEDLNGSLFTVGSLFENSSCLGAFMDFDPMFEARKVVKIILITYNIWNIINTLFA